MYQIKMVVFDMAGTTVKDNREVETCFEQAAQASNLPYTNKDILAMMGWSKRLVFETLWKKALPDSPDSVLAENTDKSYRLFTDILENHYKKADVSPTEGCLELFDWLKQQDIIIALTTGFYRKVTNIILKRLGWDIGLNENYIGNGLINLSLCSDEVLAGRPAPDLIKKCMDLFSISNTKAVINIGDTPSDLASGIAAGCKYSLGVTNGTHTKEQLEQYPNDGLLANIGELKSYIF